MKILKLNRTLTLWMLSGCLLAGGPGAGLCVAQQQPSPTQNAETYPSESAGKIATILPVAEARETALRLPEDRGIAALVQSLRRLDSFASVMAIVAHPDDEDGAMLTYESRGLGARASLLTLTRGEGGQNAMSADSYDALGLIRTNELLRADEFYGVHQYWGTEVDFGFSKTQEESFARWGHERVLYDAVLAVRRERPLVITSTFVGGITDGHGHHQVAGEIAQEVYDAAGDPHVFPEQLAQGLRAWQPRAVFARTPFAPITDKGMFDYATGEWAPARFYNYVTKEWSNKAPSVDVTLAVGQLDPVLGRSNWQIAREGLGEQKSQNGGANPTLSGDETNTYHLYASRWSQGTIEPQNNFFPPSASSWAGLGLFLTAPAPAGLTEKLAEIELDITHARNALRPADPAAIAPLLASAYRHTLALREFVNDAALQPNEKADVIFELDRKLTEFQTALSESLGLDLTAFRTAHKTLSASDERSGGVDETPRSVTPGEGFLVRVHTTNSTAAAKLVSVHVQATGQSTWKTELVTPSGEDQKTDNAKIVDQIFSVTVPKDAFPTQPYFTRTSIEQPYYDLTPPPSFSQPDDRGQSFMPYPLIASAEFDYEGVKIFLSQVVQTLKRVPGVGGGLEPLVVTPAVGLSIEPSARILPLDGSALPVRVTVHTEKAAEGMVRLKLPAGWTSMPAEAHFNRASAGDTEPIEFIVKPLGTASSIEQIKAEATSDEHTYNSGWQRIGYTGLRPYNLYRPAELRTRRIDARIAPGLRIGYVMGTGDLVPDALEGLGAKTHLLTTTDLTTGDLSSWSAIVIGIRAYSVRPELVTAEARLEEYMRRGGTLLVEYQSANFPAPFPLTMGETPERVVDESAPVQLITSTETVLNWPNAIKPADFNGWVEERGHSFLKSWDAQYTTLTETADAGQDPQRGGLLVAHLGKGTYIYCAFALHRQLPELVPGAYRLLANFVSVGAKQQ